jgi:DNA polymerase V
MEIRHSQEIQSILPIETLYNLSIPLPLFSTRVQAGFASPADDFVEEYLNLNELLVKHEQATYFVRVAGRSMIDANIFPDDILIVDRSLEAVHNKIVLAVIDGEVTVKRFCSENGKVILKAENPEYKDIHINGELNIWGVVTSIVHQV